MTVIALSFWVRMGKSCPQLNAQPVPCDHPSASGHHSLLPHHDPLPNPHTPAVSMDARTPMKPWILVTSTAEPSARKIRLLVPQEHM